MTLGTFKIATVAQDAHFLAFSGHPFMLHGNISLDFMKTVLMKSRPDQALFPKVTDIKINRNVSL